MRKKYIRQTSLAASWSPRFGGFSFFVLVVCALLHRFSFVSTKVFLSAAAIAGFCAFVSLVLALKGLYDLWKNGDRGGLKSMKGIVYSLITFTPIAIFIFLWFAMPPLSDISTDTDMPPRFIAGIRPVDALPVNNDLSAQAALQLKAWPQMSGRRYDGSPDRILKSVRNVLNALGWPIEAQRGVDGEDEKLFIETKAKTFYLGFVSDIVIRLTDEGDTTFVDMRSASRYLSHDLGIDAAFIMIFMDMLDTEMLSTPVDQDNE
ncbi:DUF1499 domain-containing protein [uncultured Bartonella sp.]|uniref:DUF1499 domain-containing protein n=1 Tax=uncultured Bartonella sp. TaxID=104108 RepID=UPI00260BFAC5|nr:DUF1499 domain-containing protein [uncultured Bartonella sp.]